MEIIAYTDGACSGNPGPGGWGVLLIAKKGDKILKEKELSGGEVYTTNNRMELRAAVQALKEIYNKSEITIITDSVYLKDGMLLWLPRWEKNGWKTSNKKPVKNQDLWQDLQQLVKCHSVTWEWVKGHNGEYGNEKADQLAREGMLKV